MTARLWCVPALAILVTACNGGSNYDPTSGPGDEESNTGANADSDANSPNASDEPTEADDDSDDATNDGTSDEMTDPEQDGAPSADDEPTSGSVSDPGSDPADAQQPLSQRELPSTSVRRLSNHELGRSYLSLVGFTPGALETIPPDGLGYAFDRVVNGQTISRSHLDAFDAVAIEAATRLIETAKLDDLTSACSDDILPPPSPETTAKIVGAAFSLNPDWAVQADTDTPSAGSLLYAPEPTAAYSHTFPAAGNYTVELRVESYSQAVESVELSLDGSAVANYDGFLGQTTLSSTLTVEAAGPALINYQFFSGDNLGLHIYELDVIGPLDENAAGNAGARQACADALIEEFGARVYRRPLTAGEKERLGEVYRSTSTSGFGPGLLGLFQALLTSPNFLYLVEVGAEVDGRDDVRQLDAWELASRLSYTLCEEPPDAELIEAASAGELTTSAQVQAQTERLLAKDCAKSSMRRFFTHWLGLNRLPSLNKSPEAYPSFTPELRQGMQAEAERYIDELLWKEEASLQTFMLSKDFWPTPETATLHGLPSADLGKETFPDERLGVLTLPGVLAVNSSFAESNPVLRAKFVLDRMMCSLPPPPDFVVTAPVPDPNLTTRERWRAHSEIEACAACHAVLDPVGFALEGFDGMGQYRTEENGQPIDTSGGLPSEGIADGELEGAVELARAIANSPTFADCFARHWMRFALGRLELEDSTDDDGVLLLTEALNADSMLSALAALTTTDSFRFLNAEVDQ